MNLDTSFCDRFEERMEALIPPAPPAPTRVTRLVTLMWLTGQGSYLMCGSANIPESPKARYRKFILGDRVHTWFYKNIERKYGEQKCIELVSLEYEYHWAFIQNLLTDPMVETSIDHLEELKASQTHLDRQSLKNEWLIEQQKMDIKYGFFG